MADDVTEMVERIARTLMPQAWCPSSAYIIGNRIETLSTADREMLKGTAYANARDILKATREPTSEMLEAALPLMSAGSAMDIWRAMIDAALGKHQ